MSEWEPATDAEVAMRDALRTDDQESYFRILAGVDLLLPVSADALQGLTPLGWGTWSTGGRTHVLAFTSPAAMQHCLADYSGSARRVPYAELANTWPNLEWWLAVNPGLPIEGYLPAWFVAQLSRGDLRLPTRGPGREKAAAPARIQDLHSAAMAANAAAAHQDAAGHPQRPVGVPSAAAAGYPQPTSAPPAGYPQRPTSVPPAGETGYPHQDLPPAAGPGYSHQGVPPASGPGYSHQGVPPASAPGYPQPTSVPAAASGYQPSNVPSVAAAGYPQPTSAPPVTTSPSGSSAPMAGPPGYAQAAAQTRMPQFPAADEQQPEATPQAAAPASAPPPAVRPVSGPPPGARQVSAPPPTARPVSGPPPATARPVSAPPPAAGPPPGADRPQIGPGGLPIRTPSGVMPSGLPSRTPAAPASGAPSSAVPASAATAVPLGYRPPSVPAGDAPTGAWPTFRSGDDPRGPGQDPQGPLPVRTPMANTPPVPEHLADLPAEEPPLDPRWSGPAGSAGPVPAPALPELPRRQAGPGDEPARGGGFPQGPASPQAAAAQQAPSVGGFPQGPGLGGPPNGPGYGGPAQGPGYGGPAQGPGYGGPAQGPGYGGPGQGHGVGGAPNGPGFGGAPQGPGRGGAPQGPGFGGAPQAPGFTPGQPAAGSGTPLPRRQATADTEPAPMTSFPAFKTPAERAATADAQAAAPAAPSASRPGLAPPVIPGAPGSDRPARLGAPQLEVRGANPGPPGRPFGPSAMPPSQPSAEPFLPANDVERDLYDAADGHSTDHFLSTLLLAAVLVPVAPHSRPGSAPGESGFAFRTEQMDGETFLVVFTSKDRLAEHYAEPTRTVSVRFYELIRNWPDPAWSFAVNPVSPIGAKYPGPQVIALASWAAEAGLGTDPSDHDEPQIPVPAPAPANDDAQHATVMQKTLPPEQVDYYLERGYDRVAGFVHRATEVEHLRTPAELFGALGLTYQGSPHQADAKEAYVLRWPAYRPSLYRIPYGGQNEQALKAMDGWVIERGPFRGNGFAPGEGRDVIAEFKVDSVRLPHGAQLWRIDDDCSEHMIAIFDNDGPQWRRVGDQ
ncbi:SseB family protein [Actinoplanes sp. NPDC051513]|uniref:SseB family protein n=1 Tax=Actinoplanes sp. NPDC051513 TaxID=3363908 RepID=UPI0037B29026